MKFRAAILLATLLVPLAGFAVAEPVCSGVPKTTSVLRLPPMIFYLARARTVPVARIAVNGSRRHAARTLQEHAGLSASEGWDCRQWSGPAKRLGRGRHVAEGWHHLVQLEW